MDSFKKIILSFKKYSKTIFVFILFFILILFFYNFSPLNRGKVLEVMYLDVGQGDSILIKTSNGQNILIDTGVNYTTNQKLQKKLPFLNKKIDTLILTHSDLDHVGGLKDILNSNNVPEILISSEIDYKNIIEGTYKGKVSLINNSDKLLANDLKILILNPFHGIFGTENTKSIVNSLEYGKFRFIFMADADSEIERNLVFKGYFDKSYTNVLKIGHHGSNTSSSEIFLKKLKPEYCIISVGKDNKYNHPNKEILNRLEKYCKNIYRTDLDGTISFKTTGKDFFVNTVK